MNEIVNKVLKTGLKHHKIINHVMNPLRKHFDVSYFYYLRMSNQGDYACFGNQMDWVEHYFKEKFYTEELRYLKPCNYKMGSFLNLLGERDSSLIEDVAKAQFDITFLLEMGARTHEGVEIYGIAVPPNKRKNLSFYLNDLSLFTYFMKKMKKDYNHIFHDLGTNSVNFAMEMEAFQKTDIAIKLPKVDAKTFMQDIGIDFSAKFSRREYEVIKQLIQGKSASEIGVELHLSKRTIEMHTENLKGKLDCESKSHLIAKCQELNEANFWSL